MKETKSYKGLMFEKKVAEEFDKETLKGFTRTEWLAELLRFYKASKAAQKELKRRMK